MSVGIRQIHREDTLRRHAIIVKPSLKRRLYWKMQEHCDAMSARVMHGMAGRRSQPRQEGDDRDGGNTNATRLSVPHPRAMEAHGHLTGD